MTKETYDLIDTSLKIGLGALISGFSAYFISRYNHKSDQKKEFSKRRLESIEKISDNFEKYFQKWSKFVSCVGGVSKNTTEKSILPTSENFDFIKIADKELLEARENKMSAISRLKLLGMNKASSILEKTDSIELQLRNVVLFKRTIPEESEIETLHDRVKQIRSDFFRELNGHYISKSK
jgi:hypothetical protein